MTDQQTVRALNQVEAAQGKRRETPNRLGMYLAEWLATPMLRAAWAPGGVVDSSGRTLDLTPNAQHLTKNGAGTYNHQDGIVPVIDLNGVDAYLSRATEAALEVSGIESFGYGGVSLLQWVKPSSYLADAGVSGKWNAAGNQRSYGLQHVAGNIWRAQVSGNGTAAVSVDSDALTTDAWHLVGLRYDPGASLAVFVDGEFYETTASIPASLHAGTAAFTIGAFHGGTLPLPGVASYGLLAAAYLDEQRFQKFWRWGRNIFNSN